MAVPVVSAVKYTFSDEKFIYTFDGKTNGSHEMKIITHIMHENPGTKKKIYVICGCHGHRDQSQNWKIKENEVLYNPSFLEERFYETLERYSPSLKNGREFENKVL